MIPVGWCSTLVRCSWSVLGGSVGFLRVVLELCQGFRGTNVYCSGEGKLYTVRYDVLSLASLEEDDALLECLYVHTHTLTNCLARPKDSWSSHNEHISRTWAFEFTLIIIQRFLTQGSENIYTYKRVVCVCLSVCFLSATRHLSTLRRCLRVLREQPSRRGRPRAARASACTAREHARACRTTSQRKNRCADAFQKRTRARMLSYT